MLDVNRLYPGTEIVKRAIENNTQDNISIGREIFGRQFNTRDEQKREILDVNIRGSSLAGFCAGRFINGHRSVSANFLRGWMAGMFTIDDAERALHDDCEICAYTKVSSTFQCHLK